MKIPVLSLLWIAGLTSLSAANVSSTNPPASVPPPTNFRVVEQGADHNVWQRETFEQAPDGKTVPKIHKYTELVTGLNYQDASGKWQAAKEEITILSDGTAAAVHGQHQAYFPADIYNGVIKLVTPDGKVMQSQPAALSYSDGVNTALIAVLTNSTGYLATSNQVVYPNAFNGLNADLRYTYTKGGFEQDVILHEQPPLPAALGLDPKTAKIEVLTEFLAAPNPKITQRKRSSKLSAAISDEDLSFGNMTMEPGKAFVLGEKKHARVGKSWVKLQGRQFLLEEVPVAEIEKELKILPVSKKQHSLAKPVLTSVQARVLPPLHLAKATPNQKPIQLAKISPPTQGYVLDYVEVNSSVTDYTFQGDTTYYVDGAFNISGTATFEGGTVVKYSVNNPSVINVFGSINCLTSAYHPAVFTSVNDNSAGEPVSDYGGGGGCTTTFNLTIINDITDAYWNNDIFYVYDSDFNLILDGVYPGTYSFTASSGMPYYAQAYCVYPIDYWLGEGYFPFNPALDNGQIELSTVDHPSDATLAYSESGSPLCTARTTALSLANGGTLHNLRISDLDVGIESYGDYSLMDAQFVSCGIGLRTESASFYAGNVLMSGVNTNFYGQSFQGTIEQATIDNYVSLTASETDPDPNSVISLTNSLITGSGSLGSVWVDTGNSVVLSDGSGVYQTVNGGNYYLATNSPYRDAGATSLNPALLADLATKTTYPPIAYTNVTFSSAMIFSPQAQRDNDGNPDLGYHYDPLDYNFGGCTANSNLTFTAGTAVGWFRTSSGWYHAGYGIHMGDQQTCGFYGTATLPTYWARLNTVQENDQTANYGPGGLDGQAATLALSPQVRANFLKGYTLAGDDNLFRDDYGYLIVNAKNSEFGPGTMAGYVLSLYLTNCLFDRSGIGQDSGNADNAVSIQNSTFHGGYIYLTTTAPLPIKIQDCALDGVTVTATGYAANASYSTYAYNAYSFGTTMLPNPTGHDVAVPGFNWQSSWFGNYYLPPSSLAINAGHTTADQVGLYHFTTQTNQVKETNSVVDIGYHYVATDAFGQPVDTDGDGTPDYIEDANGNGLTDGGETSWGLAPVIVTGPAYQTLYIGDDAFFHVVATGVPAVTYQWSYNGTPISGATSSTLELDNIQLSTSGTYSVTVMNSQGSASASSGLTVYQPYGFVPLAGNYTNYVFLSDMTYLVSTNVNLYGTSTFQGGAVIKYANHPTSRIVLYGAVAMPPTAYRPVIFTSRYDDLFGSHISNNNPSNPPTSYQVTYLVEANSQTNAYKNLRMMYAGTGIASPNSVDITDGQFVNCGTVVSGTASNSIALHNVLIAQTTNCVATMGSVTAEFLTADHCLAFNSLANSGSTLIDSLLTGVGNTTGVSLVSSVSLASSAGVYQSVGGGNYYLATNSFYRDSGSGSVSAGALADIQQKTTQPPLILTNDLLSDTVLAPLWLQDSNTPDLGYHYPVLDYLVSVCIYNGTLTLADGVAVAYNYSDWVVGGIGLRDGSSLVSSGLADHRNYLVHYSWVQEGQAPLWTTYSPTVAIAQAMPINSSHSNTNVNPTIDLRFTSILPPQSSYTFYDAGANFALSRLTMFSCEVHCEGGSWVCYNTLTNAVYAFTNNLFVHPQMDHEAFGHIVSHNNLFVGQMIETSDYAFIFNNYTNVWTNQDNAFDNCQAWLDGVTGYNAFLNGAVDYNDPQTGDVVADVSWYQGTLGSYYQVAGSPLSNAGSTTADQLGLYHYTQQTSQTKEANSVVDIGYHYVATDFSGHPLDSDGDGIPDYLADGNGNGIIDPGEPSWYLPPVITGEPVNQTVPVGGTATFHVQAASTLPLTYQWRQEGVPIAGATSDTLTIVNAQNVQAGHYDVLVANDAGQTQSRLVVLVTTTIQIQFPLTTITAAGVSSDVSLDIYATPSLTLAHGYRVSFFGSPGQSVFKIPLPSWAQAFFAAGSTDDNDADGLTAGYEHFVAGSDANLNSTINDGIPDGWKAEWGLDPTSNTGNNAATADPDGDGISNLNEYLNGTDPFKNNSTPRPVVTIAAASPVAVPGGADATFTISRTGSTAAALAVTYTIGGTAVYNTDYQVSPGSGTFYPFTVTIPAGSAAATITVHALGSARPSQTVIVGLVPISIGDNSSPATWAYVVDPAHDRAAGAVASVATPTLSPGGGAYVIGQNVTVSCATAGATIHYTLTGVDPTTSDPTVASGSVVPVPATATLKVRAFLSGTVYSVVQTANYTIAFGDADGDGLIDQVEAAFGGTPGHFDDANSDGIPDWRQDTDGDGLPDGYERMLSGQNWNAVEPAPTLPSNFNKCSM